MHLSNRFLDPDVSQFFIITDSMVPSEHVQPRFLKAGSGNVQKYCGLSVDGQITV